MLQPHFDTLIFDIGDVLFTWSPSTTTTISPKLMRRLFQSTTWEDYERGRLDQQACYDKLGLEFSVDPEEVRRAGDQARDSLRSDDEMTALIRELKAQDPTLKIYAMSNMSLPDYAYIRTKPMDWGLFDHVFTSGAAGERKPHLGFFSRVIAESGMDPHAAIFIDDKAENVLSARSMGMHGIVFDDKARVGRALRNLIGDPIARGREYLRTNQGRMHSRTNGEGLADVELHENLSQLLILDATDDRSLVDLVEHTGRWSFLNRRKCQYTAVSDDLDTTSLALTILPQTDKAAVSTLLDEMLQYVDSFGVIQTSFEHKRPHFDPVACLNILCVFYSAGRGSDLARTTDWVYNVLANRAYLEGTRRYTTAEAFLYSLVRLLQRAGDADLHSRMKPLLKERITERIGIPGDSLALAMRVLTCEYVGVRDEVDMRELLSLQCDDGGWEMGWAFKDASTGALIGNRGLCTALAVKAVMSASQESSPVSPADTLVGANPWISWKDGAGAVLPATPLRKTHKRHGSLRNSLSWLVGGKSQTKLSIQV